MHAKLYDADYKEFCSLIYEKSRIDLGSDKKEMVSARLGKRLKACNKTQYEDYLLLLKSSQGHSEITHFIDALSTNHTSFFREKTHFEFMQTHALPVLTGDKTKKESLVRVWSSACSTGEEPFSIAIVLAEYFKNNPQWRWEVVGSDISNRALQLARSAVFSRHRLKHIPNAQINSYFEKGSGAWQEFYRVKAILRENMDFKVLNLFSPYPFPAPFDIIFCRNVMIYFNRSTQCELIHRLLPYLRSGGYLFIGHAEGLNNIPHALKSIKPAIYKKP